MGDEKMFREIWKNVPKPVVESPAYYEMMERLARKARLKGPMGGGA